MSIFRISQKGSLLIGLFDWAVIVFFGLAAVIVTIGYLLPVKTEPPKSILPDGKSIKVELFGGCSRGNEVVYIAVLMRKLGIDVAEIEKESGYIYPKSLLVDRRGNPALADSLVKLLGLPKDRIVVQRYNLVVDATVVIGLDYPQIIKKLQSQDPSGRTTEYD